MPWKSQGEKRKCEERKGTGSREREKEKDGNGKDGRIYPLEDIWDYLSIAGFQPLFCYTEILKADLVGFLGNRKKGLHKFNFMGKSGVF